MKSHQEERMVDVLGPPRHVRHDEGGCDGKDRTALLETNAATQELLFDRGLCITAKRIAPWKGVGKQFGIRQTPRRAPLAELWHRIDPGENGPFRTRSGVSGS